MAAVVPPEAETAPRLLIEPLGSLTKQSMLPLALLEETPAMMEAFQLDFPRVQEMVPLPPEISPAHAPMMSPLARVVLGSTETDTTCLLVSSVTGVELSAKAEVAHMMQRVRASKTLIIRFFLILIRSSNSLTKVPKTFQSLYTNMDSQERSHDSTDTARVIIEMIIHL